MQEIRAMVHTAKDEIAKAIGKGSPYISQMNAMVKIYDHLNACEELLLSPALAQLPLPMPTDQLTRPKEQKPNENPTDLPTGRKRSPKQEP